MPQICTQTKAHLAFLNTRNDIIITQCALNELEHCINGVIKVTAAVIEFRMKAIYAHDNRTIYSS